MQTPQSALWAKGDQGGTVDLEIQKTDERELQRYAKKKCVRSKALVVSEVRVWCVCGVCLPVCVCARARTRACGHACRRERVFDIHLALSSSAPSQAWLLPSDCRYCRYYRRYLQSLPSSSTTTSSYTTTTTTSSSSSAAAPLPSPRRSKQRVAALQRICNRQQEKRAKLSALEAALAVAREVAVARDEVVASPVTRRYISCLPFSP